MAPHESLVDFYRTYLASHFGGEPLADQIHVYTSALTGPHLLPYQKRDFYKIALLTAGTSQLHYASRSLTITQPALVFSNPLVPYAWEKETGPNTGIYCAFTEAFWHSAAAGGRLLADSSLFRPGGQPVYFPDEAQLAFLQQLFRQLMAESASGYSHKQEVQRNYLQLIMHEALKMQPATFVAPRNAAGRIAALFVTLLEEQFPLVSPARPLRLRTPHDYAAALAVHVNHLNRAVRAATGLTTTAHLAGRLVREATALLHHSQWSIAEIADGLGFTYPTYFSEFFKKHTGSTPLQVRQRERKMV
ncbi:helix-turn-helix domain-containing protein [Hymenobacter terricola]|uniref:helix-turn-helix domain-containing protein n=1 Tax=Hymenobacter terricola TaxID=2819236 RepID=UPI001B312F8F|nr:helix-turn-helix domain-containing protein [Hymenobacter terricola]